MKITFHGHSCFVVEHGDHRVIIDPFLTGNPVAVIKPDEIKVDAVLLTHGHSDHVGDAEAIAKNNDAVLVAPFELAMYFGRLGVQVHPMHLGGGHTFPFGRVKLTLAFHGSGVETDAGVIYAGNPCGYLLTMGNRTFFHAGDTALFGDLQLIGARHAIDVAALPIGDNFTMGPEDALVAAQWVNAKQVIPMHYNTFGLIQQDAEAYLSALSEQGLQGIALQPGESFTVE